jgi:hypothetical protein
MQLKLTIDIFSGRPNPSLTLSDADSRSLLNRLSFGRFRKQTETSEPFPSVPGYRGTSSSGPENEFQKIFFEEVSSLQVLYTQAIC